MSKLLNSQTPKLLKTNFSPKEKMLTEKFPREHLKNTKKII